MSNPRVSVICPFYNSERFLAEAIDSVFAQDFGDFELILIDDGSTDSSTDIALRYCSNSERVRYIEHAGHVNLGAAVSRNAGIAQSCSPLLAFIDSDDVWRPHKLADQVHILDRNSDVGMVCGAVNHWRSWCGGRDRVIASGLADNRIGRPPATALRLYPLGLAAAPCPSDLMVRRAVVEEIGGFEPQFVGPLQLYEDQAFLVKFYLAAPVFFASEVWLNYRLHDQSCVSTVTAAGLHRQVRQYFFAWFAELVQAKDFAGKAEISAAVAQAQWELDHPFAGWVLQKARLLHASIGHWRSSWSAPLPNA